ncbi:hypothetical protein C8Q70DRAFT_81902 [Cubamyces menziesii]|nr:hypothetical protein C8Q70DRAFT_81902 [Cubamyces menziesii]
MGSTGAGLVMSLKLWSYYWAGRSGASCKLRLLERMGLERLGLLISVSSPPLRGLSILRTNAAPARRTQPFIRTHAFPPFVDALPLRWPGSPECVPLTSPPHLHVFALDLSPHLSARAARCTAPWRTGLPGQNYPKTLVPLNLTLFSEIALPQPVRRPSKGPDSTRSPAPCHFCPRTYNKTLAPSSRVRILLDLATESRAKRQRSRPCVHAGVRDLSASRASARRVSPLAAPIYKLLAFLQESKLRASSALRPELRGFETSLPRLGSPKRAPRLSLSRLRSRARPVCALIRQEACASRITGMLPRALNLWKWVLAPSASSAACTPAPSVDLNPQHIQVSDPGLLPSAPLAHPPCLGPQHACRNEGAETNRCRPGCR